MLIAIEGQRSIQPPHPTHFSALITTMITLLTDSQDNFLGTIPERQFAVQDEND
jgi:hypothetical protein